MLVAKNTGSKQYELKEGLLQKSVHQKYGQQIYVLYESLLQKYGQ